jgi:hypothetical protein
MARDDTSTDEIDTKEERRKARLLKKQIEKTDKETAARMKRRPDLAKKSKNFKKMVADLGKPPRTQKIGDIVEKGAEKAVGLGKKGVRETKAAIKRFPETEVEKVRRNLKTKHKNATKVGIDARVREHFRKN